MLTVRQMQRRSYREIDYELMTLECDGNHKKVDSQKELKKNALLGAMGRLALQVP